MAERAHRHRLALTLLAPVLAAVVWQAPQSFVDLARDGSERAAQTKTERLLPPVSAQDFPIEAFVESERLIPEDATYFVLVGDNLPLSEYQHTALVPLLQYWLYPRRLTRDIAAADWAIAYGAPTETLGVPLGSQVEVAPAIVVAEIER